MTNINNNNNQNSIFKKKKNKLNDHELNILASVASVTKWLDSLEKRIDVCRRNEKMMATPYARCLLWTGMVCANLRRIDFHEAQRLFALQDNVDLQNELLKILNENIEEFTVDLLGILREGHIDMFSLHNDKEMLE